MSKVAPDIALAERLFARLAAETADVEGFTRASYGPGEQLAYDMVAAEAARLGLRLETDAAANLYLTLPGESAERPVYIGSHLDTVPRGGNYDGAAGVLAGLAVVAGFVRAGRRPPRDLTVMVIRAEESPWFAASYIGSRGAFGLLRADELTGLHRAGDGVRLGDAIRAAGGDPELLARGTAHLDTGRIGLFVEAHIEQGPHLIAANAPLGVVSGIRGALRYRDAVCLGAYAHSGATPRAQRQDAVRATAALIGALEARWDAAEARGEDLSVTVGKLSTDPAEHAFSKVPGRVDFSLDLRSRSAETLAALPAEVARLTEKIGARYDVRFTLGPATKSAPAEMDAGVQAALRAACARIGAPAPTMACGAGHDAAVFAQAGVPTGLLFVRNANGSHNPAEALEMADFAAAARALTELCLAPPP